MSRMTGKSKRSRAHGEGTVYKRAGSKSWAFELRVGGGQRTYKGGFRTQKEASEALARERVKLGSGDFVKPNRITLADYLTDAWLPSQHHLKPATRSGYEWIVKTRIVPRIGRMEVQAITGPILNRLYRELLTGGRERIVKVADGEQPEHGLSAKSVREVHMILRKAFGDAVKWGMLSRNPAVAATPPKSHGTSAPKFSTWNAAQLTTFLRAAEGHQLYPLFVLGATTGMRRGELLGLRWSNVVLGDAPSVTVVETVVAHGGKVENSTPKTRRSARTITLDAHTSRILREHRKAQIEERMALGLGTDGDVRVFTRADAVEYRPDSVGQTFGRIAERTGLPHIRLHDLRHTFATLALQAGMHPKVVQERLGHEDIAITLQTYSHVLPEVHSEAANLVAGMVLAAG